MLMAKLLFTPLFHDATFVGRILSFLFRLSRILIGLFAFFMTTILLIALAIVWMLLPVLAFLDGFQIVSRILLFGGVGLFIIHITTHPHKKVWSFKKGIAGQDLWSCSEIKKGNLNFANLLKSSQVQNLLSYLEIQTDHLPAYEIQDKDNLIFQAWDLAVRAGSKYLGPCHFFVAAIKDVPQIDQFLLKLDLKVDDFESVLFYLEKKRNTWRGVYIWDEDFAVHHLKGVNRGWLGVPTPNLDLAGEDLTKEALNADAADFIRSNGVVEEMLNILSQATGRNVVLVGAAGSGKSALVKHLAKQIVIGDAPQVLATKRVVLLDFTKLVSGTQTEGDLAQKIKDIFEEVSFAQNVIVVLEEIHDLGVGEASKFNIFALMLPYLESDNFQFIATTEPENYSRILEKQGSFARLFVKVEMPPASPADTLSVLETRAIESERKDRVKITLIALKTAVELARKLIHDRVLPDSAISILKEAQTKPVDGWVTAEVVKQVISTRVNVPIMEVGNLNKEKLLNLEGEIHQRIIDQEQAVKVIADSLRRSATGIREEGRPIGSFLFVGPTGVGKTELAKALAQVYFKTEGAYLRFDMSEYQTPESVNRLIGTGGEGGTLTEEVRNRPYALILLDEFEKADPKILTIFLQVLDDGRLTDGAGRTIDFTNTIIIATSNAGSLLIAQGLASGKNLDQIDKEVNEELLKEFRPELVNRFDDVVLFKPLSPADLQKIVILKLTELQNQMKGKGFLLQFDNGIVVELAKKGFDPVLGARPLRRLIQDTLEANLSKLILENKLVKGTPLQVGIELLS